MQSSKLGMFRGKKEYLLSIEGIRKGYLFVKSGTYRSKRSDPRDWDKVRVHFFLTGFQLFFSSNFFQPGVIRITSVWMGWNSMTRMVTEYVWLEITSPHIHTVWMSWKESVMISGLQTSWLTVLMTHTTEGICGLHLSYLELWAFFSLFLHFILCHFISSHLFSSRFI